MWHFLYGWQGANNDILWKVDTNAGKLRGLPEADGLMIAILYSQPPKSRFAALEQTKALLRNTKRPTPVKWIVPKVEEWTFDLDEMKQSVERLQKLDWLHGTVDLQPDFELDQFSLPGERIGSQFRAAITFYLTKEMVPELTTVSTPVLSHESRWEAIRLLGQGGQGKVWLVRDVTKTPSHRAFETNLGNAIRAAARGSGTQRDEAVATLTQAINDIVDGDDPSKLGALKVLHKPEDARDPEQARERIKREIEAMSKVSHPNLLKILESDSDEMWFVSEYHPNRTLLERQESLAGNVGVALRTLRPVVAAVAELHSQGIVHRDIKPQNVFQSADDQPILGDLGLVYFADEAHTRLSDSLENVGSWDWMRIWAQGLRVEDLRPTFDVFSLGKVLWWMVSGLPVQRLKLWYFNKPESNVEHLFPNAPFTRLLNDLLAKCVVEDEAHCLANAQALLERMDNCLMVVNRNADPTACKECGIGEYSQVTDPNTLESVGVKKVSAHPIRVYRCSNCGHVKMFSFEGRDPWTGKEIPPPAWIREYESG